MVAWGIAFVFNYHSPGTLSSTPSENLHFDHTRTFFSPMAKFTQDFLVKSAQDAQRF